MSAGKDDNYPREFHISEILLIGLNALRTDAFGFFILACVAFLPANIFVQIIPLKEILKFDFSELNRAILFIEFLFSIFLYYMGVAAIALKTHLILAKGKNANLNVIRVIGMKFWQNFKMNVLALLAIGSVAAAWIFTIQISQVLFLFVSIPMCALAIYFIFTFYAFATHDLTIFDAMKCSYYAVYGRWGKVFGYTVIILILHMMVGIALSSIRLFEFGGNIIAIITNTVSNSILSYFNIAFAVFFINFDDTRIEPLQIKSKQARN